MSDEYTRARRINDAARANLDRKAASVSDDIGNTVVITYLSLNEDLYGVEVGGYNMPANYTAVQMWDMLTGIRIGGYAVRRQAGQSTTAPNLSDT